jgi:2-dehydropantoate 2-reductase
MNILIVGPGAMGCLFAARLAKSAHTVTLLDYKPDRAELINTQGILVEGVSGEYRVQVPVSSTGISSVPDVVLICVKAGQTLKAAESIRSGLGLHTRIITLQNGLGNLETLEEVLGKERVLGGVTAEGATLLAPGHLRHAGQGETVIGPEKGHREVLSAVISTLNEAGFQTRSSERVQDLIWGKLIVNVGINALTAITRMRNGQLPRIEGTRTVMAEAVHEAVAVAHAKGVSLPYDDPLNRVLEVCQATSENIASMLQDVIKEQATEVAFINGAIVREAERLGLPSPVNRTLTCLVQAIQETYGQRVCSI